LVRTTESAALVALRKIHNRVAQGDVTTVRVSLPPEVAVYLLNQKRDDVAQLERRYATRIQVVLNAALMSHQSELEVRTRVESGEPELPQIRLGGVADTEPAAEPAAAQAGGNGGADANTAAAKDKAASGAASAEGSGGKRRRRRRGRRRGRGRQAAAAIGEAFAALAAGTSLAQGGAAPVVAPTREAGLTGSEAVRRAEPRSAEAGVDTAAFAERSARAGEADQPPGAFEPSETPAPAGQAKGRKTGGRRRGRRAAASARAKSDKPPARRKKPASTTEAAAQPAEAVAKRVKTRPRRTSSRPRRSRAKPASPATGSTTVSADGGTR
jgi:ribonuclease E